MLREQMLRCDLLVIGRQGVDDEADWRLGVAPQDVVLEIGRPLLLVPPAASFKGDCVVVAWKDTREARRALWDALPLLKRADMVLLAGVQDADEGESIDGAAAYLRRHAVRSVRTMRIPRRNSVLTHLLELGDSEGADLLIAGAYGHSRTREWVLGGVTREILLTSPMCCLLTH